MIKIIRIFFVLVTAACLLGACSSSSENLIILCAGDSMTESSYPRYLQRILATESIRAKVINIGRSGNTSGEYLEYLTKKTKDLEDNYPDYILLQLGTNDVRVDHDRTTSEQFYRNMKHILAIFDRFKDRRGRESKILLALIPPVPEGLAFPFSSESHTRVHEEINPLLKKLAAEEKVPLVDNHSLFIRSPQLLSGVHPTEEGYRKIARNWFDALLAHIK
jgi:lysophospholipase L1-like esterase